VKPTLYLPALASSARFLNEQGPPSSEGEEEAFKNNINYLLTFLKVSNFLKNSIKLSCHTLKK